MKNQKRKIPVTLLLTVLLIAVYIVTLVAQNALLIRRGFPEKRAQEETAINSAAEEIGRAWKKAETIIEDIYRFSADLSAYAQTGGREAPEEQPINTRALIEKNVNFQGIILRSEVACEGYALLITEDPASETGFHVVYKNDLISDGINPDGMGLTTESLRENAGSSEKTLTLKGKNYRYSVGAVPEMDGWLIMLMPTENLLVKALSRSTYTIALIILLLFGFVVAASSVAEYIRKNPLPPGEEQKYRPDNIRRIVVLYGLIGVLLVAAAGWIDQSLNNLYEFSVKSRYVLEATEKNLEMNYERDSRRSEHVEQIYMIYGEGIADVLNNRVELRSGSTLRAFCDRIGASSITLYDSQGKETACSGDYIDLELGKDPSSATWEFRRILKGVYSLFRGPETDEQTGLNEIRLGIRLDDPSEEGKYDVMIIALDPSVLIHDTKEEINTILGDMTGPGATLWISDLATGTVLVSGDRNLIGKSLTDLDMDEGDLKDGLMRDVKTESGTCHVASSVLNTPETPLDTAWPEGLIAFYSERSDNPADRGSSILISCIAFLVMLVFLQKVSLSGYTEEYWNEHWHSGIRTVPEKKEWIRDGEGSGASRLQSLRERISGFWSAIPPGKKGLYTAEIITVIFLLQQIPLTSVGKDIARDSVYYYLTTGNWNKGPNVFALAATMNLAAEILLDVIFVQAILKTISVFTGAKGKTICRLVGSLVRYIALFNFLILGFSYLGVDRATILTSVAALSLALSLGAQDLISDVISGVAIVFEGTFHVGDIVEIADSTGEIMEIGIRCTKILERDGDIVTVSNRNIGKVINMTQHSSWYPCHITVSSSLDIEEIESMLREELPKIGEGDLKILSGPVYKGVTALGEGTMTLTVSAECDGNDYEYVRQKLNRELQRLFRIKGIQI